MIQHSKETIIQEKMKFFKGVIVGTMFTVGTAMLYKEGLINTGSKILKRGKRIAKRAGFM